MLIKTADIVSEDKEKHRSLYAALFYCLLEQMTGIEPASSAWEAEVLPLNYICIALSFIIINWQ